MKILICYASTDGQTRKIARFCVDQLFAKGHSVELLPVGDADPLDLALFDAAILAGSVHVGRLQGDLADFALAHCGTLNAMPTLLLQVSLSAAGGRCRRTDRSGQDCQRVLRHGRVDARRNSSDRRGVPLYQI